MKRIFYILPIILISLARASAADVTGNPPPSATTEDGATNVSSGLKDAASQVDSSSHALINLKDLNSLSPSDELAARKKVVGDALSLAIKEVTDLQDSLSSLPKFKEGSREAELAAEYSALLNNYLQIYNSVSVDFANLSDIDSVKAFAKQVIDFRNNTYNSKIDEIADFALLFYANDTISTASNRLSKITSDISKLSKLNLIKITDFKPRLDKVVDIIKDATANYLKAQAVILKASDSAKTNADQDAAALGPRDYLENSLTDIKDAYDAFLSISRDVRKALGLSSK